MQANQSQGSVTKATQRAQRIHHTSRYSCRAITGLHGHVMEDIIMYYIPGLPAKDIMFRKQINHYYVMKEPKRLANIIFHEQLVCHFLIRKKDRLFFI